MMLKKLTAVTNKELDRLPMDELRSRWYGEPSGQEHYRYLKWITGNYILADILEIGTGTGCSAVALTSNPKNQVTSYDLACHHMAVEAIKRRSNLRLCIGDILNWEWNIKQYSLIFIDTNHDGVFEQRLLDHLTARKWTGIVLLDDIHLNPEMKALWERITQPKQDITHLGHWSGTGIVEYTN